MRFALRPASLKFQIRSSKFQIEGILFIQVLESSVGGGALFPALAHSTFHFTSKAGESFTGEEPSTGTVKPISR